MTMTHVNNIVKEKRFRFPKQSVTGFGRAISCAGTKEEFWSAAQMENSTRNTIVVKARVGDKSFTGVLETRSFCHQPFLFRGKNLEKAVVWNEYADGGWKIKIANLAIRNDEVVFEKLETVFESDRLCLHPVATIFQGRIWVAWTAVTGEDTRVHLAKREERWRTLPPLSKSGLDAFRPTIKASTEKLFVVWDRYRDGHYEIAGKIFDGGAWTDIVPVGMESERWFCPDLAVSADGEARLCWVALHEVMDGRGIVDHDAFAIVAKITDEGRILIMGDDGNERDRRIVADLREGLLAKRVSKGYLGLRRRPRLSFQDGKTLWCFWEVRVEGEATAVLGHLAGRRHEGKGWSKPVFLANVGYGYATAESFEGNELPVSFYKFNESHLDILNSATIDVSLSTPHEIDSSQWSFWKRVEETPPLNKSRKIIEVNGERYFLFWADTHCHSNFSADAEGEPDEIIHFGRDVGKLDALCVIDNDYYPNKTLSQVEWRIHQELARHFTKKGEFALFPGYEFTYHRSDLNPDFNHRCVIYPGPEGKMMRRIDSDTDSDVKLLAELKRTDAMCYPHHCTYELIDSEKEWNVEVCSSWRVVLEESDFSIRQLKAGRKFGFIGSSDAHRANPGLGGALTGLFAKELTAEALFDAYKNRRTIVTQGFAIHIDFRVNDTFVGTVNEVPSNGAPKVTANIKAPRTMEFVNVLRDGETVFEMRPRSDVAELVFMDRDATPGEHFYILKVKLEGEPAVNFDPSENAREPFSMKGMFPHNLAKARGVFAWTSPIWVRVQNQ